MPRAHVRSSSALLIFAITRFSTSVLALDMGVLGNTLSARSFAKSRVMPVASGTVQCGPLLLMPGTVNLRNPTISRNYACPGASPPTLDSVHLVSLLAMQSFGRLEATLPACGVARLSAPLSLLDFAQASVAWSVRSHVRLEMTSSISNPFQSGLVLMPHSMGHSDAVAPPSGITLSGSSLPALDHSHSSLSLSSRSFT